MSLRVTADTITQGETEKFLAALREFESIPEAYGRIIRAAAKAGLLTDAPDVEAMPRKTARKLGKEIDEMIAASNALDPKS